MNPLFTTKTIDVIAVDLDNTLLRSDRTISARSIDVLKRCEAAGKRLVIATARPRFSVAILLPPDLHNAVWICQNGAEIYHRGERIFQSCIADSSSATIIRWLQAYRPSATIQVQAGDNLFSNIHLGDTVPHWAYDIVDIQTLIGRPMTKIIVDLRGFGDHSPLMHTVPSDCTLVVTDGGQFGQIMDASVSKSQALRFVLGRWKLGMENVIAFGDDIVDLDLIKESGIGVAMSNALPEVKAVAGFIAKSNDEDGVAETLEQFLLEPGS